MKQINRRCAFPAVRIYCTKASSQEELLTVENGEETDAGRNEQQLLIQTRAPDGRG